MAAGAGRDAAALDDEPSGGVGRVGRVSGPRRFSALRRSRHTVRRGPLRIAWVAGDADTAAAAYAIGRRVGTAVARNRLRRRLRAAMSEAAPAPGDYLVQVEPAAATLPFCELKALVKDALRVLGSARGGG